MTLSHSDEVFDQIIHDIIVGEIYELIGKIRNANKAQDTSSTAFYAVNLALKGAWVIGLANRHLYTSSSRLFPESLALPDRPAGYNTLCEMVMGGNLADLPAFSDAADAFWAGVEAWARKKGIPIEKQLRMLLASEQ